MIWRILFAIIVACAVFLGCQFVALLLTLVDIAIATQVAGFLRTWAIAIAILVGLWQFVRPSVSL